MAFGIKKKTIQLWKHQIDNGEIAFLTHFWLDERFPDSKSVTKVGCNNLNKLARWGEQYHLKREWIHIREDGYSHFDLLGKAQKEIMKKEDRYQEILPFIQ